MTSLRNIPVPCLIVACLLAASGAQPHGGSAAAPRPKIGSVEEKGGSVGLQEASLRGPGPHFNLHALPEDQLPEPDASGDAKLSKLFNLGVDPDSHHIDERKEEEIEARAVLRGPNFGIQVDDLENDKGKLTPGHAYLDAKLELSKMLETMLAEKGAKIEKEFEAKLESLKAANEELQTKLSEHEKRFEAISKLSKCFDVVDIDDSVLGAVIKEGCTLRAFHGDHEIRGNVQVHGDHTTWGNHATHGHHTINGGNLYVHDGSGSSKCTAVEGDGSLPKCTGVGNIFVGHAPGDEATVHRSMSGSHNIVLGTNHEVSSHGGIISGTGHTVAAPHASAIGGSNNTARGLGSLALGGSGNIAGGQDHNVHEPEAGVVEDYQRGTNAVVLGGEMNQAMGEFSSVTGGADNLASGRSSSVTGGYCNSAYGIHSSVTGGNVNEANGNETSVTGGSSNEANGADSIVTGGIRNKANQGFSTVTGGWNNQANGQASSVFGGQDNQANHDYSSVLGGG